MNVAYLSIGTNLGEREQNLAHAVALLQQQVDVKDVSAIYETAPVGVTDQPSFLNICVKLETDKDAQQLLDVCQFVEQELGRVRLYRWGPRSIDLDILLFNHENIETERLIVPHERMFERAFVLVPLADVSDGDTPQLQQAAQLLTQMDLQQEGIMKWAEQVSVSQFVQDVQ